MQVLVIGYGKIGQIKALLWKSLGASVFVHDVSQAALKKAVSDGLKTSAECKIDQDITIDISSPAGQHYESLKWCLDTTEPPIRQILIEKPLASSPEELKKFRELNELHKAEIVLNESYFSSEGLRRLIDTTDGVPTHIEIELSKNRLDDIAKGRFFDHRLGAIGIETPHMLAILQMFDVSLDETKITKANLYVDARQHENQGYELCFQSGETSVGLRSFLGNFNTSADGLVKTNGTIRSIKARTKSQDLSLEFDPATNLPRYHSRLSINPLFKDPGTITEFADDHLREHMVQLLNKTPINALLKFDNAVYLSDVLTRLRDSFNVIDVSNFVSDHVMETMPQIITQEGV